MLLAEKELKATYAMNPPLNITEACELGSDMFKYCLYLHKEYLIFSTGSEWEAAGRNVPTKPTDGSLASHVGRG